MATAPMTAVRGYSPPSREELAQEIRHYAPAMHLYQGSPEWLFMEIHGRMYHMPPDLGGRLVEHPVKQQPDGRPVMVPADGLLAVRDVYGILRDKRNFNRPTGVGLLEGQDSGAVVMFAVENYQERGVVWLRGDETDDVRKAASKKLYSRFIRGWAEQQRSARQEAVRNFQSKPENKGLVPPPPTPIQQRAQEILDNLAIEKREGHEFICNVCYGWEGSKFEKYAIHMKAAHGRVIEPPKDDTAENTGHGRSISGSELASLETPVSGEGGTLEGAVPPVATGAGMSMAPTDPRAGGVAIDEESPAAQRRSRKR